MGSVMSKVARQPSGTKKNGKGVGGQFAGKEKPAPTHTIVQLDHETSLDLGQDECKVPNDVWDRYANARIGFGEQANFAPYLPAVPTEGDWEDEMDLCVDEDQRDLARELFYATKELLETAYDDTDIAALNLAEAEINEYSALDEPSSEISI